MCKPPDQWRGRTLWIAFTGKGKFIATGNSLSLYFSFAVPASKMLGLDKSRDIVTTIQHTKIKKCFFILPSFTEILYAIFTDIRLLDYFQTQKGLLYNPFLWELGGRVVAPLLSVMSCCRTGMLTTLHTCCSWCVSSNKLSRWYWS